jgi:predicted nucleic acid-binding protein
LKLVVDASVAVKWFLPDSSREPDADRAAELLRAIGEGRVELLQPPHWLAEVAAVIARLRPQIAARAIDLLDSMELAIAADAELYKRASRLAQELDQHLFDTLYHALALENDALLVTADDRYLRKAGRLGKIVALDAWAPPSEAIHG